jgi:predicted hydrocarbon binding protein
MSQQNYTREHLGEFGSVVCFKAVITGVEDTLGTDGAAVVFTRAGKMRGHNLVRSLGLQGSNIPVEQMADKLNAAIGKDGTRLCHVKSVRQDGENIVVEAMETMCSAFEPMGSDRNCTFTLGAIGGAIEAVTGKMLQGKQTTSVLRGSSCDTFVYTPF